MGKYAILLVSALIFSLLTYSQALRNALFISNTQSVQSFSQNQAHNIAQGVAMVTINDLRNNSNSSLLPESDQVISYPSNSGFENWGDMEGSYNVQLTNQADTLIILQSTGRFDETDYRVTIGLTIGPQQWNPDPDQAVHAEDDIDMSNAAEHSVKGDVSINNTSNSSVKMGTQSRVKITDDLYVPGGGENVVSGNLGNLGGDVQSMQGPLNFQMPIFPGFPTDSPSYIFDSSTTELNPSDYNGYYINAIDLSGNKTLTINTGDEGDINILHVGRLDLQASDIILTGEGKLTVYVETELAMNGNSELNKDGEVNQLMIYYKGDPEVDLYDETLEFGGNNQIIGSLYADKASIKLNGTAGIVGNIISGGNSVTIQGNVNMSSSARVIYAPNALVQISGSAEIFGSVISHQFKLSGSAGVTYVKNLDADLPDLLQDGGNYSVSYWN